MTSSEGDRCFRSARAPYTSALYKIFTMDRLSGKDGAVQIRYIACDAYWGGTGLRASTLPLLSGDELDSAAHGFNLRHHSGPRAQMTTTPQHCPSGTEG